MSVRVMERVWRHGPSNPTERLVLLCLADKATDDGRNAFPAMATIAERTALSQRTVERTIDRLVANGYLLRQRRYMANGRRNRSNLYTIVLSRLEPNAVMVTVLDDGNTDTVTVLDDGNTDTVTPSNTVTVTPSNTVTVTPSNTVTVTPDPSIFDPSSSDPSNDPPPPPARKNGAIAPGGGGGHHPLRAEFERLGYRWDAKTRAAAALSWMTAEFLAAWTGSVKREAELPNSKIDYWPGVAIYRMTESDGKLPPAANSSAAESPATAWQAWQAVRDANGNGRAALATLDATTQRMIEEFGRGELARWDAEMFARQYRLAQEKSRRRIAPELEAVMQR